MAVDQRFYRAALPARLTGLTDISGLPAEGLLDISISGISTFEDAIQGELCFVDDVKLANQVPARCAQGAVCLTTDAIADRNGRVDGVIVTDAPRLAFFEIASRCVVPLGSGSDTSMTRARVHPDADVHPTAILSNGVVIGPNSVIGPYAYIEVGVQIGSDCVIGSSAQIGFALIGNGVEIGSGVAGQASGCCLRIGGRGTLLISVVFLFRIMSGSALILALIAAFYQIRSLAKMPRLIISARLVTIRESAETWLWLRLQAYLGPSTSEMM